MRKLALATASLVLAVSHAHATTNSLFGKPFPPQDPELLCEQDIQPASILPVGAGDGAKGYGITPGGLSGELTIDLGGQVNYNLPLWSGPGRLGVKPDLGLDYSSTRGDGLFGTGWRLSGLGVIELAPRTVAKHGSNEPIRYDGLDPLVLNGTRLVPEPDGTYRLEDNPLVRVSPLGNDGKGGIDTYKVETPKLIKYYGGNDHSRRRGYDPASGVNSKRWLLSRVEDRFGNAVHYEYTSGMITAIRYTSNSALGLESQYSVAFDYVEREFTRTAYREGETKRLDRLINRIRVVGPNNVELRRYELSYARHHQEGNIPRISRIQECADDSCTPAVEMEYARRSDGFALDAAYLTGSRPTVTDWNGDGRDDLLVAGSVDNGPSLLLGSDRGYSRMGLAFPQVMTQIGCDVPLNNPREQAFPTDIYLYQRVVAGEHAAPLVFDRQQVSDEELEALPSSYHQNPAQDGPVQQLHFKYGIKAFLITTHPKPSFKSLSGIGGVLSAT